MKKGGEGIHHIAFLTNNLEKAAFRFKENGGKVLLSGQFQGGGFAYFDFEEGNIILELFQI